MSPSRLPEDPPARQLRQAQELLDERPAPRVRAAVLEAAARHHAPASGEVVGAPPRPAPAPVRARWLSWRPGLAIPGAALAGVLAISIALRVQQQAGTEPAERSVPALASNAPAVAQKPAAEALRIGPPSEVAARRDALGSPAAPPAGAPAVSGGAQAQSGAVPGLPSSPAVSERNRPVAANAEGATQPQLSLRQTFDPSAVAPAAMPPPTGRALEAQTAPEAAMAKKAFPGVVATAPVDRSDAAAAPAPAPAPALAAPSAARTERGAAHDSLAATPPSAMLQGAAGAALAEPAYRARPEAWLDRIAELRGLHRDAEADEELRRFRLAHPRTPVPDRALRR